MTQNQERSLRIIIAGGGTGGHVFPAIAIREAIGELRPDAEVLFVGTRHGLEYSVLSGTTERLKTLWISGFSRRQLLKNISLPVKIVVSFFQSLGLLLNFRPQMVIGTGGYVMGPVLWFAQTLGIPTIIQEQNSFPGFTTRCLARRARLVCVGFDTVRKYLPDAPVKVTGNPLRTSFRVSNRDAARQHWDLDYTRKTILVFGGSAGARSLNKVIASAAHELLEDYNLIWQTGRLGVPAICDRQTITTASQQKRLIVKEFIHNMPEAYAAADIALCRAGAMTLAELSASGLPAILVPYPYAADDHQTANARTFVEAHACAMLKDSDLTASLIIETIRAMLQSSCTLTEMSAKMKMMAHPNAAREIAEAALTIALQK